MEDKLNELNQKISDLIDTFKESCDAEEVSALLIAMGVTVAVKHAPTPLEAFKHINASIAIGIGDYEEKQIVKKKRRKR